MVFYRMTEDVRMSDCDLAWKTRQDIFWGAFGNFDLAWSLAGEYLR
jgi:hypothetical protein